MTEFERKLLKQNEEMIAGQKTMTELLRNSLSNGHPMSIPLSTEDIESKFGVSRRTLKRHCMQRGITPRYLGNRAFYYLDELFDVKPKA